MNLGKYVGTLVKLINTNNMSEIWGTLLEVDGNTIKLKRSIIVVNRAIADLATTFNDIIQYKYQGNEVGSTIATPLGPIFNNDNDESVVYLKFDNYVIIPIHDNGLDINADTTSDSNLKMIIDLKGAMEGYIESVYKVYAEMTHYMLDDIESDSEDTTETIS